MFFQGMKELVSANIGFNRWFFFVWGMAATIAYRIIIFLQEPWVKAMWYLGTVGFIFYFGHRAHVQKKRSELVLHNNLITTVSNMKVAKEKKKALEYLVRTAVTSKSRWNSLLIVWLSVLALGVALIYDFVL